MSVKNLLYKIYNDDTCYDIIIILDAESRLMKVEEIGLIPFSLIKEMAYCNLLTYYVEEIGFKNVHIVKCEKRKKVTK